MFNIWKTLHYGGMYVFHRIFKSLKNPVNLQKKLAHGRKVAKIFLYSTIYSSSFIIEKKGMIRSVSTLPF